MREKESNSLRSTMRRKSSRNSKKSTGEKSEIDPLKTSSNNSDAVRSSKRWASEVENEQDKNQSDNPSQEGEDGTQNVITDHDDATENVANDQSVKESACKDTDVQEEGASEEKDNEGVIPVTP
ncbi:hypothetical protein JTB14_015017 [Gonioctena quinquepunctata]|nr:hypothetical protein JTB14_015017 [Gonioctena quinquepunctata]